MSDQEPRRVLLALVEVEPPHPAGVVEQQLQEVEVGLAQLGREGFAVLGPPLTTPFLQQLPRFGLPSLPLSQEQEADGEAQAHTYQRKPMQEQSQTR